MWLRGAVALPGVERVGTHNPAGAESQGTCCGFLSQRRNRPMVNLLLPLGHSGSDFSTLVLPG